MVVDYTNYSLYFHIPFCTRKCDYCHFYVIPDRDSFKSTYMQALKHEWTLRCPLLPKNEPISIYFGGGTPSLLGPDKIETILSWISPSQKSEITLEANPETVHFELMKNYKKAGINRISLGVQSFDDSLLTQISRTHTASQAVHAIETTHLAGLNNLSIDLMYDLPNQSLASWEKSLTQAIQLPIAHLSLYNLTIEPNTVFYKKRNTLTPQMPDETTSAQMLEMAVDRLEASGLKRYEISAFARNGLHSKHNIGYWTMRPFLGFGPSAFSYWNKNRFRNISHLNRYAKALDHGNDPIDFSEILPFRERLKEAMAIGLRLTEGMAIGNYPKKIQEGIEQLQSEGWIEREKDRIRLTTKGLLFHDTVAERVMNME